MLSGNGTIRRAWWHGTEDGNDARCEEGPMVETHDDDLFGGDFSQARAEQREAWPAKLQWHGGISRAPGDSFAVRGGFFLPEAGIFGLGLDPAGPPEGAAATTMRFADKIEPGWGFARIDLAILAETFFWEHREDGRQRFHRDEYRLRQQQGTGAERELRGRVYVLAVARQLLELGATEPVLLTMRGAASRQFASLLRERLAPIVDTATRMRNQRGHTGPVPREAFWLPLTAGPMTRVGGEEGKQSEMALPATTLPEKKDLPGGGKAFVDFARPLMVPAEARQAGGQFDQIWERYQPLWDRFNVFGSTAPDEPTSGTDTEGHDDGARPMPSAPREDDLAVARTAAVAAAIAAYAGRDPQRLADYVDTQAGKVARDPQQPTARDYDRVAAHLRERAAGERPAIAMAH